MPIVQQGSINTTALIVPDLYVQIVPPQNLVLNGVPTNVLGVVGTAQWGPVGTPMIIGSMADYARNFGAVQNRKYDMGTAIAAAVQQGASNFRAVRVTDGTDAAASLALTGAVTVAPITLTYAGTVTAGDAWGATYTISGLTVGITQGQVVATTGMTLTQYAAAVAKQINLNAAANGANVTLGIYATSLVGVVSIYAKAGTTFGTLTASSAGGTVITQTASTGSTVTAAATVTAAYTGTAGNSISLVVATGSAANSWNVTVNPPTGGAPEQFRNIPTTGFWSILATALANGQGPLRGPSQYVTLSTPNLGVGALAAGTYTLVGGVDGAAVNAAATLVGVDTVPRKGMYALRGQGCSIGMLADADDSTQWSTIDAFGQSEGIYMIQVGPAGDTISNAVTVKGTAGLDSYSSKLMFGDWLYWFDQANQVTRLISPQGFVAGRLANLSPEQSSLNKRLYSVIGSQKAGLVGSGALQTYSAAELQSLFVAGIDVITNPGAGGLAMWTCRAGHNSSSNASIMGDNYTRMTNFAASTLAAGMGVYVGQVINPTLFQRIRATILGFCANMVSQGLLAIGADGSAPYSVVCDATNNPTNRTGLGYVQADVQIQYQGINEKFIVNLEGGATVQVQRQTTATRAA